MEGNFITHRGYNGNIWFSSSVILTVCVTVSNIKVLTFSYTHSYLSLFIIIATLGLYTLAVYIVNLMSSSDLYSLFIK